MKVQLGLFVAVVLFFVSAYGQDGDPQIYCGRRLAQVMAKLCYINYEKRSGYDGVRLGEPEFGWPWITAPRDLERGYQRPTGLVGLGARDLGARDLGARGKRGIVEDCCENSCSIETLMSYC